jgi:hypothetical protein
MNSAHPPRPRSTATKTPGIMSNKAGGTPNDTKISSTFPKVSEEEK